MKSAHRGAQEYTEGKRIREAHSPVRKRIGLISREHGSFQFHLPLTGSRKGLNWYLRVRKDQLGPHGPFPPRPAGPYHWGTTRAGDFRLDTSALSHKSFPHGNQGEAITPIVCL